MGDSADPSDLRPGMGRAPQPRRGTECGTGMGCGTHMGCGTWGATPSGAALRALPSYPPIFPSDQTGLKAIEITWEGRRTSAGAGLLKTVPPHRL